MAQHYRRAGSKGGLEITWGATHRDGICCECQIPFVKYVKGIDDKGEEIIGRHCPQCKGELGNLIVRFAGVAPPAPPDCISPSCLWSYVIRSITFALVVSYHKKRIAYAELNRRKKILERYRTGEPSPQTFWQAIHANIKLTCPVCRKYNVDPLIRRNRK